MPDELKSYIDALPFIDTHSHVAGFDTGGAVDDKAGRTLPQILFNDYLLYLSGAAGDVPPVPGKGGQWRLEDAEEHFRTILPLLEQFRALTTYATLREGIRELHPFPEPDITLDNWRAINEQIVRAYREHGERAWHRRAAKLANVIEQNQMVVLSYVTDHWDSLPAHERQAQKDFLLPSLILDGYLFTGFSTAEPGRLRSMELVGMSPKTHAEYLQFCAKVLDLFASKGGKSVKLLTAYHRKLRFEEVGDEEAAALFARGPQKLASQELARLQDNLCWHLLELANARRLPLIVHTGYATPTSLGDPEDLMNLLRSPRLRGLKIDLCHSGWPNEGGAMIMARTYRHCYFNLCWTPLLSRTLGKRILSEAIDIVPMNKILLGTDCGSVEGFVGTARLTRAVLHEVLAEKVTQRQFTSNTAKCVARALLHDNAREFYAMPLTENSALVGSNHLTPS